MLATEACSDGTDLVVWVPAAEVQQIVTLYARTARLVRAPGADGADPEADAHAFLAWAATTSRSWLVVLNDVTDPDGVGPWWPAGPNGWVLATSRFHDARMTGGNRTRIDVDLYTPDEAVAYLETRLAGEAATHLLEGRAAELAHALGRLPLALAHAAACLINEDLTAGEYLQRLEDSGQLLEQLLPGWADTEQYGRGAAAALLLSLDAAHHTEPAGLAEPVLRIAALLDPAGHPGTLWQTPTLLGHLSEAAGREVAWSESRSALRVLHRYHLLAYDSRTPCQQIRIHALTARATRETTPVTEQPGLVTTAADALLKSWPDPEQHHRELAATLRANTDALHLNGGRHLWNGAAHPLLFRSAISLHHAGLYRTAHDQWHEIIRLAAEFLGPDHPDTHYARTNLANSYSRLGRYADALVLHEQALDHVTRTHGPDHPDNTWRPEQPPTTYRDLGRHQEAADLAEQVLAGYERTLGPDHPDTFRARANLAVSYDNVGRHDEARALGEQAMADGERILGPHHPATSRARDRLAATYLSLGAGTRMPRSTQSRH
ncbi:tetratricopeptide repeat protein [Streptomyces bambusae]|uniref:tetratricopeptide repeat protein n=1 Tax=Streptomyces bambusae TaxID=1550616 RepID=UPI0027DFD881|nr:tetratricopeptide repeat protein [Streptomyces bambusae]